MEVGSEHEAQHYLNTGQRTCLTDDGREIQCEGSGQDASFAVATPWPEPRFDVRGDEGDRRLDLVSQRQSG